MNDLALGVQVVLCLSRVLHCFVAHLHDFSQLVVTISQSFNVVDMSVPYVVVALQSRATTTPYRSGSLELINLLFHYEVELARLFLFLFEQLVVFLEVGHGLVVASMEHLQLEVEVFHLIVELNHFLLC